MHRESMSHQGMSMPDLACNSANYFSFLPSPRISACPLCNSASQIFISNSVYFNGQYNAWPVF